MTETTHRFDGTIHGNQPVVDGQVLVSMRREDHQPSGMERYGTDYGPPQEEFSDHPDDHH